jgi:hypothetical protein
MPHIHTGKGEHDHTVSAYILRTDGNEARLLLHKHKKLGVYLQFGGHIELHETPWQAITHEIQEESGYQLDQLQILQPKHRIPKLTNAVSHPQPVNYNTHPIDNHGNHFHSDIAYAFITDQEPINIPGDDESSDIVLFTREELIKTPKEEIFENCREIGLFIFDTILNEWDKIPAQNIDS